MAVSSLFPTVFFFLSIIFSPPSKLHRIKAANGGFAVRLIHRDSPSSPFYDANMTTLDRAIEAANRSIARLNHLHALTSPSAVDISSRLVPDHGEYLMMYNLGTPPTQVYAIVDTGSSLTWLQCLPCKNCFKQTQPIFDPSKSSTFNKLSCASQKCNSNIGVVRCSQTDPEPCNYEQEYADGSTTKGALSTDVFAFEDPMRNRVDVGSLIFGCAGNNPGSFGGRTHGIVGLNQNSLSLVSQLGIKKFSYCMVVPDDEGSGSRMYFGSRAVISGGQTPLETWRKSVYYVKLEGISIGNEKVPMPDDTFDFTARGFVIDSGSTLTMLKTELYNSLEKVLKAAINLPQQRISGNTPLSLCFAGSFEELDMQPDITIHFENADVMLTKQSTYIEVKSGIWCLAMVSSNSLNVLGNTQQQNYWVGYDLDSQMVSFAPVDCATF